VTASDPRLRRVRGLIRVGRYMGLTGERIRQLAKNDPYFPKPALDGRVMSWSEAQFDAYTDLRGARRLRRELSRRRMQAFTSAETMECAGEHLVAAGQNGGVPARRRAGTGERKAPSYSPVRRAQLPDPQAS